MKKIKILAVESSCDETSIAIVENGKKVISLATNTQIKIHEMYGGVVPEIASRMHTENITFVLESALNEAGLTPNDIDAIAVTYGPGLTGSLLIGIEFAKTLSLIYNKPLIPVNHLIGHIYANNLENELKYPLLSLIVSGGHTELLIMEDDYKFKMLGKTLDDAIGESFDKVAKALGVTYPGGPNIERMASLGNETYSLPTPILDNSLNFSYSGLKSAVINIINNEKQRGNEIRKNDMACSFQNKAIDQLSRKVDLALEKYSVNQLVVAGGVSANKFLKKELEKICLKYNVELKIPNIQYCTDNAAMIGAAAYPLFLQKKFAKYDLNAESGLTIIK